MRRIIALLMFVLIGLICRVDCFGQGQIVNKQSGDKKETVSSHKDIKNKKNKKNDIKKNKSQEKEILGLIDEADKLYDKRNYGEALEIYKKVVDHGNLDYANKIGYMYQYGLGVEKDDQEAANWYIKAAEFGNANAQDALGWMYQQGTGLDQNYEKAFYWYRKAAE